MIGKEAGEEKSFRVNGFCQSDASCTAIKRGQSVTDLRGIRFNPSFRIKPYVITSVDEFINIIATEVGPYDYKTEEKVWKWGDEK